MNAAQQFRDAFTRTAALLPHSYDSVHDRVLLVRLSEQDYRSASFLDQRILTSETVSQWIEWDQIDAVVGPLPDRAAFIFHIGHVGSTLISRLLGELPGIFSLREPQILRDLADLHRLRGRPESPWAPERLDARLPALLGWLSRAFDRGQQPIVKASSFVSDLAGDLPRQSRKSLFLYARPETYLATIFGGEASRRETAVLAGARLTRLHRRLGDEPWRLWQLSEGERVAMSWACEMTALNEAMRRSDGMIPLDFDAFLAAPDRQILRLAEHYGAVLAPEAAAALVDGPILRRYSKAPEHGYSPDLRQQVLAQARSEHSGELRRGMAWLDEAARSHEQIAAAMAIAARED